MLTISMIWAISAANKIGNIFIFPRRRRYFARNVKTYFLEKYDKYFNMSSAEIFTKGLHKIFWQENSVVLKPNQSMPVEEF